MARQSKTDIVRIRPARSVMTRQQLANFVGVSGANCGSMHLSMNLVVIPPGKAGQPHLHRGYETAVYLLTGRVRTRYGPGLRKWIVMQAGDFLYIPADVPHQPVNLSRTHPARAVVVRNDPNEQESVELYEPAAVAAERQAGGHAGETFSPARGSRAYAG